MTMFYSVLTHILSFLLDLTVTARMSEHQKDLELLLLRQQLRILQRTRKRPPRLSRGEKLTLALLAARTVRKIYPQRGVDIKLGASLTQKG